MVPLSFTGSRRSSAASLADDSGAGGRGASPQPTPSDDEGKIAKQSPAASYLGRMWRWGGDSSGNRPGLFDSRTSQVLQFSMASRCRWGTPAVHHRCK